MGQKIVRYFLPLLTQHSDGTLNIDGVPQGDRGHDEIEPARPASLTLLGSVPQFAQAVEEDSPRQRIARLSLVQPCMNAAPEVGVLDIVQEKQGPLQSAKLSESKGKRVLTGIGSKLAQQ